MNSFIIPKQNNKPFPNKKESHKYTLYQKINNLNKQIFSLKQIHKDLLKLITKILKFIPQQIIYLWNMINNQKSTTKHQNPLFSSFSNNNTKSNSNLPKNKPSHKLKTLTQITQISINIQNQPKQKIESLRYNQNNIKNTISQELRVIKMLQHKQRQLRINNQRQQKIRRSLSKDNLYKNCLKDITKDINNNSNNNNYSNVILENNINQSNRNNYSNRNSNSNSNRYNQSIKQKKKHSINPIYIQNQYKEIEYSRESSPKFGSSIQNTNMSSFQSFNPIKQLNSCSLPTPKLEVLTCSNNHQYYKGNLNNNNIPHGKGSLLVCCQKFPLKINAKTLRYDGYFNNGLFQGKGVLFCKGSIKFEGMFIQGKRNGQGIINLQGKSQRGIWQNDRLISFI